MEAPSGSYWACQPGNASYDAHIAGKVAEFAAWAAAEPRISGMCPVRSKATCGTMLLDGLLSSHRWLGLCAAVALQQPLLAARGGLPVRLRDGAGRVQARRDPRHALLLVRLPEALTLCPGGLGWGSGKVGVDCVWSSI